MNAKLKTAAETTLHMCLGIQKEESVLVVYDANSPINVVNELFRTAQKAETEVIRMEIIPRTLDGQEPPDSAAYAMQNADVVIAPTSKSLSHTNARREATKKGVRIASLPGITEDIFIRGMQADYNTIHNMGKAILPILNKASQAHLTSQNGSDLTIILGNEFLLDDGYLTEKGSFGNLPAGEVFSAPMSNKTDGILVVDRMGDIITEPTKIKFKNGTAVSIQQNESGARLKEELSKAEKLDNNKNAYIIAELGIGLNESAQLTGNVLEDEKILGTAHIAVGDNSSFPGGKNSASIHLDGIITSPTLTTDSTTILENGIFLI